MCMCRSIIRYLFETLFFQKVLNRTGKLKKILRMVNPIKELPSFFKKKMLSGRDYFITLRCFSFKKVDILDILSISGNESNIV